MYSFTRRATLAVLLVAALLAVLGAHAEDIQLNTAGSVEGKKFVNAVATINIFKSTNGASSVAIDYTDSTVTGDDGLTVKGLASGVDTESVPVTTTFTTTLIVDSTITVSDTLPSYYGLAFVGVEATSQSATKPVFVLNSVGMAKNNTLVIRAVSAKWASGDAGVVAQVKLSAPQISTNSGLFITSVKVDGSAASVFSSDMALTVSDSSIFAVDVAECTGCTQPIVRQGGTLEIRTNSVYRVSGVTAGSSTLVTASAPVSVSGGSIFQVSDSSVTGSNFFDFGGSFALQDSESKAVFTGLTGSSVNRVVAGSGKVPSTVCATCNVYGGSSSSTASGNLDTVDKWTNSGVTVTVVVDDKHVVSSGTANGDAPSKGQCSDALCLGANTESFGEPDNCGCQCKPGYNAPSCSTAADQGGVASTECTVANCLACNADGTCANCMYGYTWDKSSNSCTSTATEKCAAPHCITCVAGSSSKCASCEAGYLADDNDVCQPIPKCTAPNCAECERLDGNTCKTCASGSTMDAHGDCKLCGDLMEGCAKCSSTNICTECVESYKKQNGTCVRKFNGATTGSTVTLAIVALLVSVLAAYAL